MRVRVVGPDLSQHRGQPNQIVYFRRAGLLPGPHAMPGFSTCGSRPILTSCPNDCERPPGPFGAIVLSRLSGAVGSSFCPENTQIELACVGPAVGLPFPVISPALAALALAPTNTAALIATTSNVFVRITSEPPLIVSTPGMAPSTSLVTWKVEVKNGLRDSRLTEGA